MRLLLETMARGLVDQPARVSVYERTLAGALVLELRVASEDRGKVIGRRGRTADALRTVLGAVGRRRGQRCEVEIPD
jgi:predicted RNA-binding protein YlqC (UPF0109 family)